MNQDDESTNKAPEKNPPPEPLNIRAIPPRVTRLNRVLVKASVLGLGGVVFLALYWGFGRTPLNTAMDNAEMEESPTALSTVPMDSFNRLPKGYSDVRHKKTKVLPESKTLHRPSMMGPSLDGELGPAQRGMEEALLNELCLAGELPPRSCRARMPSLNQLGDVDKNAQLIRLKQDADALKAPVFFKTNDGGSRLEGKTDGVSISGGSAVAGALARLGNQVSTNTAMESTANLHNTESPISSTLVENNQRAKTDFLRHNPLAELSTESTGGSVLNTSPYIVRAGTIIPCALLSGINSDLPGDVTCQVREPVYDTATGRFVLIPQGTRVLGTYDSVITHGQSRILLVWRRLLLPDGRSVNTGAMPAVDLAGYAGLSDRVNHHYGRLLGGILASSLLSATTSDLSENSGATDGFRDDLLDSAGNTINRAGQKITQKNLDIQPTHEIRPGWSFNILVNKDLSFTPFTSSPISSLKL